MDSDVRVAPLNQAHQQLPNPESLLAQNRGAVEFNLCGWMVGRVESPGAVALHGIFISLSGHASRISSGTDSSGLHGRLRRTDISCGVCLYHCLVINVFVELGWTHSMSAVARVYLFAVLLGLTSWFVVEKRALSLKLRRPGPAAGELSIRDLPPLPVSIPSSPKERKLPATRGDEVRPGSTGIRGAPQWQGAPASRRARTALYT